jgi:hypothetical protein
MRTFEYRDPVKIIKPHSDGIVLPRLPPYGCKTVPLLEYALAIATIVNLAQIVYDLTLKTVTGIAAANIWYVTIWATTAIAVHLFGWLSLWLRVRIQPIEPSKKTRVPGLTYLVDEFTLSSCQADGQLWFRAESYLFVGFSCFTSIGNICHIVMGTLTFSSLLFIDTTTAVKIFARIFANTVLCRTILMYELTGMRQTVVVAGRETDDLSSKVH